MVTERLLTPLRMTATTFAATEADIPSGAVRGHRENGWRAPYWYGQAYCRRQLDLDDRRRHDPVHLGG